VALRAEFERLKESHFAESTWSLVVQALAIAGAAYSYATLPDRLFTVQSNTFSSVHWLAPLLWGLFFASILAVLPPARFAPLIGRLTLKRDWRLAAAGFMWFFGLAQLWVIGLLIHFILQHRVLAGCGTELIHTAGWIEGTTIAISAFVFWMVDSGGPVARQRGERATPDLLWPQMESSSFAPKDWRPSFLDYLYLSFTNATAFSPTDVMPLTSRMKMAMMLEAAASAVTVLLVAARAVNILK
jgi:hypothetical protein